MRNLVSEKKMLLALLSIGIATFLFTQITLFSTPVLLSEKGLVFGVLSLLLLVFGFIQAAKAIRRA